MQRGTSFQITLTEQEDHRATVKHPRAFQEKSPLFHGIPSAVVVFTAVAFTSTLRHRRKHIMQQQKTEEYRTFLNQSQVVWITRKIHKISCNIRYMGTCTFSLSIPMCQTDIEFLPAISLYWHCYPALPGRRWMDGHCYHFKISWVKAVNASF